MIGEGARLTSVPDLSLKQEEALVLELCARYYDARHTVNRLVERGASSMELLVAYEVACLLADELSQFDEATAS